MFYNNQSFRFSVLKTTTLAALGVAVFSYPVFAQDLDMGDLPPQPTQSTLPEDQVPNAPDVPAKEVGKTPSIADAVKAVDAEVVSQPTAPLTEPVPEPEIVEYIDDPVAAEPTRRAIPHSNTYYDADSIGPSALGNSAGPRRVDPRYEPGSSFVVVRKDASSSSRQASVVAAQRALKLGRYSSALELYEQLYKKNPKNTQILMGLAVSQQYSGFNESAIATYEELLRLNPKNSGATVNLMGLLENRNPRSSMQTLQKLWNKNTRNPAVAAQLGLVYAKMGDYDQANKYLGIATSLEPRNALHYYNLAIVMDQANSTRTAIEFYQKALEVDVAHNGGGTVPREVIFDRLAELRRL